MVIWVVKEDAAAALAPGIERPGVATAVTAP
jgi:hypothetical protein